MAADEPTRYHQIDLQAEASREVQNDTMQATLFVEANDANAAALSSALNRSMNEALRLAAEAKGVRARSGGVQTLPIYDRANKLVSWRGRAELRLDSRDFGAMGALIGRLQQTMQLGMVQFLASPELRRGTENELITEAIGAFRARADIVREAIAGQRYRIRRMTVATGGGMPPRPIVAMRAQPSAAMSMEAPAFEGGVSQIQVTVSGTVEIE